MLRAATIRSPSMSRAGMFSRRNFANGPLEADAGGLATHVHHTISLALAALTPVYFMVPDDYTDGMINKVFGVGMSGAIAAHSWIGLNYIATDYVPKVSKALLGPSRIVSAGIAAVTFLGLSRVAVQSPGGIKSCVKGLWYPSKKE